MPSIRTVLASILLSLWMQSAAQAQSPETKEVTIPDGKVAFVVMENPKDEETFVRFSSQARLLIHGGLEVSKDLWLNGHFIPSGNLVAGLSPLAFLELLWKPTPQVQPGIVIGHAFGSDSPILALHLAGSIAATWYWVDFEWQPSNNSYYWFAQWEYHALDWLELGVEEESYGDYDDFTHSSHGGGPNVLFQLDKHFELDATVHVRNENTNNEDQLGWVFITRVHIKLFKEKTTVGSGSGTPP